MISEPTLSICFTFLGSADMSSVLPASACLSPSYGYECPLDLHPRCDRDRWKGKRIMHGRNTRSSIASITVLCGPPTKDSLSACSSLEILKVARNRFNEQVSFGNKDKDISLAKVLLYVAAEDEVFMTFNKEVDALSFMNEREGAQVPFKSQLCSVDIEEISLSGRTTLGWLNELDNIAKEAEADLEIRDSGFHLVEVLEAVSSVLFGSRGFKKCPALVDSNVYYLHNVLSARCGSGIMLCVIYMEICRRFGVTIVGSRVGEDFLIWPRSANLEELFKDYRGCRSLFDIVNGSCVENPRSKSSDIDANSLSELNIATNRDIIGFALADLIRFHWKCASRVNHGLMLTSPLRPVQAVNNKAKIWQSSKPPLLRPQELRLATMAAERLLVLQPHNWSIRRDHGMLLYYGQRYGEAVQELSICIAFAPGEAAEVLQSFVEKLHLLRLESSWEQTGPIPVP